MAETARIQPRATPTPMPALAPVERLSPPLFAVVVGVLLVDWIGLEAGDVCVFPDVDVDSAAWVEGVVVINGESRLTIPDRGVQGQTAVDNGRLCRTASDRGRQC